MAFGLGESSAVGGTSTSCPTGRSGEGEGEGVGVAEGLASGEGWGTAGLGAEVRLSAFADDARGLLRLERATLRF